MAADLRSRVFALAEALFQTIRMQLSVPLYKAISVGRGATLDTIDAPLNNRAWLEQKFAAIRKLPSEPARIAELDAIVNWTNPGPGGFYDDLGDPCQRPHLVTGSAYDTDPAGLHGARTGFDQEPAWRRSWCRHGACSTTSPCGCDTGLDQMRLTSCAWSTPATCSRRGSSSSAGDSIEVHPFLLKPRDMKSLEFDLPREATRTSELNLSWHAEPGRGGNGRGCQVSEVWLIKK